MPKPEEGSPNGRLAGWLTAVKGLTITNALVILILLVGLGPAYIGYRLLNDPTLLDKFLSSYTVYESQMSPCTVRKARQRGEPYQWGISTGFAFEGGARWSLTVIMDREPGQDEIVSYCEALLLLVDHMRTPQDPAPTFPGTDKPIIREYRNGGAGG